MQDFGWVLQSLRHIWPEVILAAGIVMVTLLDLFPRVSKTAVMLLGFVVLLAALTAGVAAGSPAVSQGIFQRAAAQDAYGWFFRMLFLGMGLLSVMFSWPQVRRWPGGQGEFFAVLLACVFGMMIMASANNLLMMFLALEFVSVASYIMTGLLRKNRKSAEGSLKYILYGAAAGGVMLFGMSFLYGLTGKVDVPAIGVALKIPAILALILSVFIAGGFAYKIAAAPFHMWCPDVYEGAPTPVTAFFSIGPKIAGFAMLGRFVTGVYPEGPAATGFELRIVIAMMALLTMAIGNLSALWQNNLKRLMAYSGIAHAGYMLLAFLVWEPSNVASLMFYAVAYLFMNLGAFLVILILEDKYGIETVQQCRGLGWVDWPLCAAMAVFLFSLVGLPPFAGFLGKLLLFGYVIEAATRTPAYDWLSISMVVAGVLFSVVSLYYYARVVGVMFLGGGREAAPVATQRTPVLMGGLTSIMLVGTVLLVAGWEPIWQACKTAAAGILGAP
jgi:NADH-quinone oxidoreductase subunit N